MEIIQYHIILVDLGTGDGSEIKKTRPCVVVSPDEMNRHLRTVVVAPMTNSPRTYPTRVRLKHNQKTGYIVADQLTTVDRKRVIRNLGKLSNPEIRKLKNVIMETYAV
jgi:mRNA interferase MazF